MAVEVLNGEPLEVHDLGGARRSPVGDHIGDVLDQLQQATPARPAGETSSAVEELAPLVPLRLGSGAVGEAAGVELHARPRRGQGGAEGMIVGRRVGRRVDDVNVHGQDNRPG